MVKIFCFSITLIGQTFNGCSAESMFSTCFVIGSSIKAQSTILHICHICKEIDIYIHTAGARALPGAARSFFIFPTECKVWWGWEFGFFFILRIERKVSRGWEFRFFYILLHFHNWMFFIFPIECKCKKKAKALHVYIYINTVSAYLNIWNKCI